MVDVTDFNPVFGTRLDSLKAELDKEGIGYSLASGYRSPEYQGRMYANHQAKLAGQPLPYPNDEAPGVVAKPWSSFHNYGLAADFSLKNDADYARLQALAPQFGLTGIGMSDKGHIQLGGSLADDIAKYKLAGWRPASQPAPTTGALAYSGPVGALAKQEVGPENAGANVPAAASSGPLDVRQLVFNKLTGAGLKPNQALGAVWSLAGESGAGLNPNAYNPKDPGGSVGIGQWQGPRRAALEAFAKDRGTAVTDPNTQADFLVDELTNEKAATYQPGVFKSLQGADTAADATKVWTSQFERPAVDNSAARIKNGTNVASLDSDGNFVLGSATGTAPSSAPAVAAAPEQTLWQKITSPQTDAQGNPVAGGKSLLQQAAGELGGSKDKGSSLQQFKQAQEDEAPQGAVRNQAGPAPGARNVSPMGGALLPSVPQTYGQTINSFSAPLTWNSAPPRAPQMPAAGLQPSPGSQIPGMSLMSFQAPQGIGYGVDPNIGYGYG